MIEQRVGVVRVGYVTYIDGVPAGVIDSLINSKAGEICEGDDVNGEGCSTQKLSGGTLTCNTNCSGFSASACNTCGDGILNADEECDEGNNDGAYGGCNSDCTLAAFCRDGLTTAPVEHCETSKDGSTVACHTLTTQGLEGCDDGDRDDSDGCTSKHSTCKLNPVVTNSIDPEVEDLQNAITSLCEGSTIRFEFDITISLYKSRVEL